MEALKRNARRLSAVLVIFILLFGAAQANAAVDVWPCIGDCPPLEGGVHGSCWQACEAEEYAGGDCTPSPPSECCCFYK
jgi:hypothetical protein